MRTLFSAALVLGLSSTAFADRFNGFGSGGLVLGGSIHDEADNGFLLGGELSGGALFGIGSKKHGEHSSARAFGWAGGYGDVIRDFGSDTTRLSFGPELGIQYFGLDGGLVREFGDNARWGFTIRPVITVGFAAVFARYTRFDGDNSHIEVGVLLKLPVVPSVKF